MKPQMSTLVLLAALLSLAACSSDNDPDFNYGNIDKAYLSKITEGNKTVSYQMDDFNVFEKYTYETEWRDLDIYEYSGWQVPLPARITFHKGELLTPLSLFNMTYGPHILYYPFEAYRIATGFDADILLAHALDYDMAHDVLTVDGGRFDVTSASSHAMEIQIKEIFGGADGVCEWKWILSYEAADFLKSAIDEKNVYHSEGDACLGIIQMLREQFGKSFDMNPYLAREGMSSSHPVVDIDALEEAVRHKYGL